MYNTNLISLFHSKLNARFYYNIDPILIKYFEDISIFPVFKMDSKKKVNYSNIKKRKIKKALKNI